MWPRPLMQDRSHVRSGSKRVFLALLLALAFAGQAHGEVREVRIAYIEPGPLWLFSGTLKATLEAMDRLGWKGYVKIPEDAYISPSWEKTEELKARAEELMARTDIDLIISAGTEPTRALLDANNHRTPIVGIDLSDPVRSGIVASETDSGVDNLTVLMEKDRFKRMFRTFHDVVGFSKLGLMFSNSENGRVHANVEDALVVARERGFEIVGYDKISSAEKTDECVEGINRLISQGIDAFFISVLTCLDWNRSDPKSILDILNKHKIPTFAREGSRFVRAGALMGFSSVDFTSHGNLFAEMIVKILEGKKPRSLPMMDESVPKISLNLKVAEDIGFDPGFDVLVACDQIHREIILPEDRLHK